MTNITTVRAEAIVAVALSEAEAFDRESTERGYLRPFANRPALIVEALRREGLSVAEGPEA